MSIIGMIKSSSFNIYLITLFVFAPSVFAAAHDDCLSEIRCEEPLADTLSEVEIEAYPVPNVQSLAIDTALLYDRSYEKVKDVVDIFDTPNGIVINKLDKGLNFVTVMQLQDDWTEINQGQWLKSENLENSSSIVSEFSGVLLPENELPYPMAWVLVNLYPSKMPGGEPDEKYPIMWRYTKVNLYSSMEINGTNWYQIGVDQWIHQFHVAKVIPNRPSTRGRYRFVD